MTTKQSGLFDKGEQFHFNERFIADHAGQIVSDPKIAVIELIANAYDAGATKIEVRWPEELGGMFSVTDNGTGLTIDEFKYRWTYFNYSRNSEQGEQVVFPPGVRGKHRIAFGQSGKGRYAPFCFSSHYSVKSWKDGEAVFATVELAEGNAPFTLNGVKTSNKSGHGTVVSVNIQRAEKLLEAEDVRTLIGTKFLVDPSITITLNGEAVELLDLTGVETEKIKVEPHGTVLIHFVDSEKHSRVARLNGIAWWVNRKMVGEPNWNRFGNNGVYLDKRKGEGRRLSFVVEADMLKPDVNAEWQKFHANQRVQDVESAVHRYVDKRLNDAMADTRRERKVAALRQSREAIKTLPRISQAVVTSFVERVQSECPTISDHDLNTTVKILARLEQSRDGYDLLVQLEKCSSDDLDTWNRLMRQWTASNAEIVLNELQQRLRLIESMKELVSNPNADELHELHPLFERGLWIFGPEYEAVDFRSNRGLAEVVGKFLGPADEIENARKRPDIVAAADSTIGTYSADAYKDGEISGLRKVLIVELKRGGFEVTQGEVDQARDYAKAVGKSGKVDKTTEIVAFVLGDTVEHSVEPLKHGNNVLVIPMVYDTVLRRAEARTFHLQRKLRDMGPPQPIDKDLEDALGDDKSLFPDD